MSWSPASPRPALCSTGSGCSAAGMPSPGPASHWSSRCSTGPALCRLAPGLRGRTHRADAGSRRQARCLLGAEDSDRGAEHAAAAAIAGCVLAGRSGGHASRLCAGWAVPRTVLPDGGPPPGRRTGAWAVAGSADPRQRVSQLGQPPPRSLGPSTACSAVLPDPGRRASALPAERRVAGPLAAALAADDGRSRHRASRRWLQRLENSGCRCCSTPAARRAAGPQRRGPALAGVVAGGRRLITSQLDRRFRASGSRLADGSTTSPATRPPGPRPGASSPTPSAPAWSARPHRGRSPQRRTRQGLAGGRA